jgi:cytochrome c553
MNRIGIEFLAAAICACALSAARAGDNSAVPPAAIANCQTCHGPNGDSASPTIPRLNGQQTAYMMVQLKNFQDPGREDPHATRAMWGVATTVDDAALAAVAAYYARETPTAAAGEGAHATAGKTLYEAGNAAEKVPACQTCHGANAEGQGTVPRLAGQHANYLKNQMERLRFALRSSDVMHPKLYSMTDDQIDALVAYLAKN